MTLNSQQFGLVAGPYNREEQRILPRLPDGSTPSTLHRVAAEGEWREAQETGVLRSRAGRLHASAQPEPTWADDPNVPQHMLEIDYRDEDGWQHKDTLAHGYATIRELPIDRVRNVRSFPNKRALMDGVK